MIEEIFCGHAFVFTIQNNAFIITLFLTCRCHIINLCQF